MSKIKVGITGGIGSGKSTIAKIIEVLGYPVYYSDQRARILMNENEELKNSLKSHFGNDIYLNETLDRLSLAKLVFQNKKELAFLNSVVHPAVRNDFNLWTENQKSTLVFQESALLFEIGAQKVMDFTILVTADEEIRVQRVMNRDNCTKEEVLHRMNNQLPDADKINLASFVIQNDEQQLVIPQVLQIIEKLKS